MNARYLLSTGILVVTLACSSAPDLETRTFELEYLNPADARDLITPYLYDRPESPGMVSEAAGGVSVRETTDNLDQIARMLERFDRAPPAVRLLFQLIEANGARTADPAIADVEAELRKLFRFDGYRLMNEATVTGVVGTEILQLLIDRESSPGVAWGTYTVGGHIQMAQGEGDSTSVLLGIRLEADTGPTLFNAEMLLNLGQTMVLGTAQLPGGRAIILTVRAESAGV